MSGTEGPSQEQPAPEPIPEFDPRVREDFEGLLYLGYLEDRFSWGGHRFVIRTINGDDILEIGLRHKDFQGTIADAKAYQMLVLAASITEIDGRMMPTPLGEAESLIETRLPIVRKWFAPTIDAVYERYLELEGRVSRAIEAMGKASGWTALTPILSGASA